MTAKTEIEETGGAETRIRAISHAKKRAFLAAYAECGTIVHAAELAGVSRRSHDNWIASDPVYAAAFRDAGEQAIQRLEQEARRRAIEGIEKPVYQGGKQVGVAREYSDTLLIFLLKAARPHVYRDATPALASAAITVVHSIPSASASGEPLTVQVAAPEALSGGA